MKWLKTSTPGIRYREHATRKHGVMPDRYYAIYYKVKGNRHDEPIGWSSQGWTLKKAAGLLAELKRNHASGKGPQTLAEMRQLEQVKREQAERERAVEAMESVSVKEFWETDYINVLKGRCKKSSWEKEVQHYNLRILPELGDRPLKSITGADVERIIDKMKVDGFSPRTIQYFAGTVFRLWKHAAKRKIVKAGDNPAAGIEKPKVANARLRVLTPAELGKILEYLSVSNPRARDITAFCAFMGCRLSEAAKLTWEFVDLGRASVLFPETKNRDSREVFLVPELVDMLSSLGPGRAGEHVFLRENGRPFLRESDPDKAETPQAFATAVKNLGLNEGRGPRDRVTFHSLRHTAATFTARRGTPVKDLQLLFGWKTPSMVFRYVKGNQDEQRRAMEGLASALQEKEAEVIPFKKTAK